MPAVALPDTSNTNLMSESNYDLVVIGSGPAGQKAALSPPSSANASPSSNATASVGGVCIHTGTIPSKAIREAVLHLTGIRERIGLRRQLCGQAGHHHGGPALPLPTTSSAPKWTSSATRWPATTSSCSTATPRFVDPHTIRVDARRRHAAPKSRRITCSSPSAPSRPARRMCPLPPAGSSTALNCCTRPSCRAA